MKAMAAIAVLSLIFDIRVNWQKSMPDDGEVVCSLKGEGFVVSNGLSGVFLRRRTDLDATCASHMK
jgi:hypothetical protein